MRWDRLFEDLEGDLTAQQAAERDGEASERARVELAAVSLSDRMAAAGQVKLELLGAGPVAGLVAAVGDGWCVIGPEPVTLVPLAAVATVTGLGRTARPVPADGVTRRLSLPAALRRVARDRSAVALSLRDGRQLTGTLDAVLADHLELSEHGPDDVRRPAAVLRVRCVPLTALAAVRAAGPSSLV